MKAIIDHQTSARRWARRALWLGVATVGLASLSACGSQRQGQTPVPVHPTNTVMHVSAQQVARSMDEDTFFADYGHATLLIHGTVLSMTRRAHTTILVLDTHRATKVLCDLGGRSSAGHVGRAITIESVNPQRDVSRGAAGVVIQSCQVP